MAEGLRKISKEELGAALEAHDIWAESNGDDGSRADFRKVDLSEHNLSRLDYLTDVDFRGAKLGNLSYSNIRGAQFDSSTDFSKAILFKSLVNVEDFVRGQANLVLMEKKNLPQALHPLWERQRAPAAPKTFWQEFEKTPRGRRHKNDMGGRDGSRN